MDIFCTGTNGVSSFLLYRLAHSYDIAVVVFDDNEEVWYRDGINIDAEVREWMELTGTPSDWRSWTDEERLLFRLSF